jgi:hypothetical protein
MNRYNDRLTNIINQNSATTTPTVQSAFPKLLHSLSSDFSPFKDPLLKICRWQIVATF